MSAIIPYDDPRLAEVYATEFAACVRQMMPEERARYWAEHAVSVASGGRKRQPRDPRPLVAPANAPEVVAKIRAAASVACGVPVAEFEGHPLYCRHSPAKRESLTCARRWVLIAARHAFGAEVAGLVLSTCPSWVRGATQALSKQHRDMAIAAEEFGKSLRGQP